MSAQNRPERPRVELELPTPEKVEQQDDEVRERGVRLVLDR
jgi:hypothetical protein